jgi:hypothetical protein
LMAALKASLDAKASKVTVKERKAPKKASTAKPRKAAHYE